jgi:hypothetical protein
VFVAGARRSAAAAPRPDEAEHGMVARKRRNGRRSLTPRASLNSAGGNEPPSTPANTGEVAPLNQPPDRRTRDAEGAAGFLNRDHSCRHAIIVSSVSHCLNRLITFAHRASVCAAVGKPCEALHPSGLKAKEAAPVSNQHVSAGGSWRGAVV